MPRWLPFPSLCAAVLATAFLACGPDTPQPPSGTTGEDAGSAESAATAVVEAGPRVVYLGTSLTAGLGLRTSSEAWPERLDRRADAAGVPIRTVNAGRSGDTSAGGLARLDWVLSEPVDVLVVELGANDGLRGQPPEALADNLRAIVDRTREAWPDARILLVGMEAPTNLGPEYTARFREVFATVAREKDLAFVPFLLEGVAGVPALNQADRIHPTAEGHARIADTVWPHLEPLLRAAAEASP